VRCGAAAGRNRWPSWVSPAATAWNTSTLRSRAAYAASISTRNIWKPRGGASPACPAWSFIAWTWRSRPCRWRRSNWCIAALIFEHAGLDRCLENAVNMVAPGAALSVVLQLPSAVEPAGSSGDKSEDCRENERQYAVFEERLCDGAANHVSDLHHRLWRGWADAGDREQQLAWAEPGAANRDDQATFRSSPPATTNPQSKSSSSGTTMAGFSVRSSCTSTMAPGVQRQALRVWGSTIKT